MSSSQSWVVDSAKHMDITLNPDGVCHCFGHTAKQLIREGRLDECDNLIKIIQEVWNKKLTTDKAITVNDAYIFSILKPISGDLKGER